MKYLYLLLAFIFLSTLSLAQKEWQVSVSGGMISPDFLIDTPLGYQIEGRVFYELPDSFQISISSGYHEWKVTYGPGGNRFKAIPILLGIKIQLPVGNFIPYLSGEFGYYFIKRNYTFEQYEKNEFGVFRLVSSEPASESVSKFGYRISLGTTFLINNFFDIDFSIRFNHIAYDFVYVYPTQISTGSLKLYSFIFGINYKI